MALPALTAEARAEALQRAVAVRQDRAALLSDLKHGRISLPAVLARTDTTATKIRVRRLFESLPGIGKVRAGQLLLELDISERRRAGGLGPRQRERLTSLFPSTT